MAVRQTVSVMYHISLKRLGQVQTRSIVSGAVSVNSAELGEEVDNEFVELTVWFNMPGKDDIRNVSFQRMLFKVLPENEEIPAREKDDWTKLMDVKFEEGCYSIYGAIG